MASQRSDHLFGESIRGVLLGVAGNSIHSKKYALPLYKEINEDLARVGFDMSLNYAPELNNSKGKNTLEPLVGDFRGVEQ